MATTTTDLLTPNDVAATLRVKPTKVYQLISDGHLNAEDISPGAKRPTWRIDPAELSRFRERAKRIPETEVRRRRRRQEPASDVIDFCRE